MNMPVLILRDLRKKILLPMRIRKWKKLTQSPQKVKFTLKSLELSVVDEFVEEAAEDSSREDSAPVKEQTDAVDVIIPINSSQLESKGFAPVVITFQV